MSEQKRDAQSTETPEDSRRKGDVNHEASKGHVRIEVSDTKVPQHEVHAIEPINKRENITTDSAPANFHLMTAEEEDLTMKLRNTGDAFYDLVTSAIERAKSISVQKAKEIAGGDLSPAALAAKEDARDIATLGESVEDLARTFENLMTELRRQPYSEQVPFLKGYKKLLEEQINVVDSRIHMAKRLKLK
ncbi:MAG: hypothetical protein M3270_00140 [Thermoproteota archaeon]|nr:hypothetical protein [Thermoproteota archaeon]